jgi:hypothetical protein
MEDFKLEVSTVLDGLKVSLCVQASSVDLQRFLEAQECVFSADEVSDLAQATLPALLPTLHQARAEWHRSLFVAWRKRLEDRVKHGSCS